MNRAAAGRAANVAARCEAPAVIVPPVRPEPKSAGARVSAVARELGCVVHSLEQRRRTTIALGLPDLIIWTPHVSLWFECKSPTDKLTPPQLAFLTGEHERGAWCACGDAGEARTLLGMILRDIDLVNARALCWTTVTKVAARGSRKET